ncbi:MAG TPA: ribonuclease HIII [bacterium]|nr:ribonuclease HIII [bacterium]
MSKNVFSASFHPDYEQTLRPILEADGFILASVEHAFWQAQKGRVFITFYRSGKVVVRGKNAEEYAQNYLNPLKAKQRIHGLESVTDLSDWIGTDESGKGDLFGPLVVAAVFVDNKSEHQLWQLGVKDSKKMSDQKITEIAAIIRRKFVHSVVSFSPKRYNQLYKNYKNLNKLLAAAHAQVIKILVEKTQCSVVICDQFGDKSLIQTSLNITKPITLIQKTGAEENLAVAAASIVARQQFVRSLSDMSLKYGIVFPRGASQKVIQAGELFLTKYSEQELAKVAKLHFKTVKLLLKK